MNQTFERSTTMNLIHEELARAHMAARLEQARSEQRGHQLATARRLSRKAERAAAQARLALARVI
ncbi:MAG: hypothetical protein JWP74_1016 [Marmoricola sp.]|nr:hypothetical protein [Marmoricola sp.]